MRNFYILISCFFVCFFLCAACTERININTDNAAPRLVITGYITTDTMPHIISVSQTAGYFGNDEIKTFSDAVVKINDHYLHPRDSGRYVTASTFSGVPGEPYTLDVALDYDRDGTPEHYTAQTTVPAMHTLDFISLHLILSRAADGPVWSIFAHFQDQPGPNTFGAHLYVNGIQCTGKLQHYYLNNFVETAAEGQYINFPVFHIRQEIDWEEDDKIPLHTGDTITFELNTLTMEYFDFLRAAKLEINGGNPLFAGPPANAPGNISGGALGVFGAYTVSRKSVILGKEYGFPPRPAVP
ncbi:MAG: DUF4249 domain-containing protein [Prevotellaceae bacterium]|jgi:hypothetical protein|nr:DUF4249 domain-containing protein [Prevotellaceae bacterium]